MSYSSSSNSEPPAAAASCCSTSTASAASAELKLYQTFIFSIPIFFTFLLLLLFYLFYLRRRRVDWSSLRMRATTYPNNGEQANSRLSESGLKKEIREMLPIIVYKESFSVKDTQCAVCLGDYEAEEKLQQIPTCKHTFHMECIDHWLSTHTTCPLCRLSLVPTVRSESDPPNSQPDEAQANETQASERVSDDSNEHGGSLEREEDHRDRYVDNSNNNEAELWNGRRKDEECTGETGEGCSVPVLDLEQGILRDHYSA